MIKTDANVASTSATSVLLKRLQRTGSVSKEKLLAASSNGQRCFGCRMWCDQSYIHCAADTDEAYLVWMEQQRGGRHRNATFGFPVRRHDHRGSEKIRNGIRPLDGD